MALSTKVLRNRISSIKNTQKITKAMELVAASKMRKAVNNVLKSRTYSDLAWEMIQRLNTATDPSLHKLLQTKDKVSNVLVILLTSNRGLCGGYNAQIINKTLQSISLHKDVAKTDIIIVGKKGRDMAYKFKQNILADFDKEDVINQVNEIFPLSRLVLSEYLKGNYDKVLISYTDFISSLVQKPRVRQILPITEKDDYIGEIYSQPLTADFPTKTESAHIPDTASKKSEQPNHNEYIFEPSPDKVLSDLLPRLIEVQIYQAYLEANASEHSARMLAMRNASDAAGDMIHDLKLTFNQARQAGITQEIAETPAGKAVIE